MLARRFAQINADDSDDPISIREGEREFGVGCWVSGDEGLMTVEDDFGH